MGAMLQRDICERLAGGRRIFAAVAATAALVSFTQGAAPAPAATWESRQVPVGDRPGDSLFGVSCPSATLCVAVGSRGTIVTSRKPEAGAGAWRAEAVAPGDYVGADRASPDRNSPGVLEAVSCPSEAMCGAITYVGDFYASGNPADGASTWRATDLDPPGSYALLQGVSCPDPTLCVAVSSGSAGLEGAAGAAGMYSIRNPLSAAPSWTRVQLDDSLALQAVSCPSTAFCIAVGRQGRVVVSTNPAAAAPGWREIGAPGPGDLDSIACPLSSLCLAGNARGNVLSSAAVTTASPSWRTANTGPSVPITGISCPAPARCLALSNNGDVAVSSDPTGPTGSWSATNLIPHSAVGDRGQPFNAFFAASCPTIGFCAAVGSQGVIFTSRDPFDVERSRSGGRHRGPKRPRMRILRSDRFRKQSLARGAGSRVTFRLRPFGRARGFVCRLDRRRFRRCRSPLKIYARVGRHVLRARAIGVTGLKGPPARARFAIKPAQRRR
jgi:hypothetical protein